MKVTKAIGNRKQQAIREWFKRLDDKIAAAKVVRVALKKDGDITFGALNAHCCGLRLGLRKITEDEKSTVYEVAVLHS
jgi:hypothetical protein